MPQILGNASESAFWGLLIAVTAQRHQFHKRWLLPLLSEQWLSSAGGLLVGGIGTFAMVAAASTVVIVGWCAPRGRHQFLQATVATAAFRAVVIVG